MAIHHLFANLGSKTGDASLEQSWRQFLTYRLLCNNSPKVNIPVRSANGRIFSSQVVLWWVVIMYKWVWMPWHWCGCCHAFAAAPPRWTGPPRVGCASVWPGCFCRTHQRPTATGGGWPDIPEESRWMGQLTLRWTIDKKSGSPLEKNSYS